MSKDSLDKMDISPIASITNIDDLDVSSEPNDNVGSYPKREKSLDLVSINSMDVEIKTLKHGPQNNASTMSIYDKPEEPVNSKKKPDFESFTEENSTGQNSENAIKDNPMEDTLPAKENSDTLHETPSFNIIDKADDIVASKTQEATTLGQDNGIRDEKTEIQSTEEKSLGGVNSEVNPVGTTKNSFSKDTDFKVGTAVEDPQVNVDNTFEKALTNSPPQIKLMQASTLSLNRLAEPDPEKVEKPFEAGNILIAISDYHAQDLDELGLKFGDIIELDITPKEDELYWLKGTIQSKDIRNGQQGFFPKLAVEHYSPDKTYHPPSSKAEVSEEDIGPVEPVPRGTTVVAIYDYEKTKQDELSFTTGTSIIVMECPEGGWWKGVTGMEDKKPVTGWFPANLVKVKEKPAAATHERPKSAEPQRVTNLELPNQENRKVSWFRRLRSTNDANPDDTSFRRNRSTSAPPNKNDIIYSDDQLNSSKESSELFPPSTPQTPTHIAQPETPTHVAQPEAGRTRTNSVIRSPQSNSVTYEIKPVGDEDTYLASGGRNSTILVPKGDEGAIVTRSRAESSNRGTIFITGQLSPGEILQGAVDQKVQDLIPPSVYKFLSDKEKQRLSVIWELMQTERDYVRDLAIIVEVGCPLTIDVYETYAELAKHVS
ncbi:hypothetical protein HDV01_006252 [Terramyces sp. JEL0728]|nr:hypothetical protein HDV01_006252 [Terramyces sp. JEL0728]